MIRLARNPRGSAHNIISGEVSTGATWSEVFILRDQDGNDVTGVEGDDLQFQFRCFEDDTSPSLTLTSDDSEVTASEGAGVTTVVIYCAQSRLGGMEGDYVADLVSKDGDVLTHRGHGTVTFRKSPVAF